MKLSRSASPFVFALMLIVSACTAQQRADFDKHVLEPARQVAETAQTAAAGVAAVTPPGSVAHEWSMLISNIIGGLILADRTVTGFLNRKKTATKKA